jgi:predicted DsbA family dithiol-disulfide isomerase
MHDALYANSNALQLEDLIGYALEVGIDPGPFERDLRAGRFSRRVARDVASADASGVVGTPTFFINEERYRGSYDLESMDRAVRAALSTARSLEPAPVTA